MNLATKQILRYSITPQLLPRMQQLFTSGFHYIAFFIALVYNAVRLLPDNHPYAQAENIGRFGIRHVIAEAANNLKINMNNIDQIILFFTILLGLGIAATQIVLLAATLFTGQATAQENFGDFFITDNSAQDLAYMMMDMVFGVQGIFNSCITPAAGEACLDINGNPVASVTEVTAQIGWPYPIHFGLHQMLALYSTGLLVVAAMITTYFVFTVVAETAQTGTPFGKRFNKVWAPLRIVMAFGLLMPIGQGLNSAQFIVLYAAKYGSGFATNGWIILNDNISSNFLGEATKLVSTPNTPEISGFLQFMYTAKTCKHAEEILFLSAEEKPDIQPYIVKSNLGNSPEDSRLEIAYETSYEDMMEFIEGANYAMIRFGHKDDEKNQLYKGYVKPYCGELRLSLTDPRWISATGGDPLIGAEIMQRYYWFIIRELWFMEEWNEDFPGNGFLEYPKNIVLKSEATTAAGDLEMPEDDFTSTLYEFYTRDLESAMLQPDETGLTGIISTDIGAIPEQQADGAWDVQDNLRSKGWAAAGIWYNRIAEMNGAMTTAVFNYPGVNRYPLVMEEVYEQKRKNNQSVPINTRFKPEALAEGQELVLRSVDRANEKAAVLWEAYDFWSEVASSPQTQATGNAFEDAVKALFGADGLYSMRRNADIHPLAQLVGIGRSLVESGINNIGYAVIGAGASALVETISKAAGQAGKVATGFITTIAMVGLTIGFLLYYVVPFLPFIYFFFAVGGWIKGIFEALVGAPLWALAHIRIDGEGLPGQAAVNGYFLIFEIFIRPILIIFGLLASISIFAALVAVLNDIWSLVTANLSGFDVRAELTGTATIPDGEGGATEVGVESLINEFRGSIDSFFYTMVYAIVVYMIGMSSFKLIDLIPNNILRWMGQSVSTFNDSRENPAESMVGTAYIGTDQVLTKVEGGLGKLTK